MTFWDKELTGKKKKYSREEKRIENLFI